MAKQGFRVMDSDLHVIEPRTLWEDYLDPKFRGRIVTVPGDYGSVRAHIDGKGLPPFADRPERERAWSLRMRRPGTERLHRGTLAKEALEAMDVEGIDVGILFRTWATQAINIDGLEPAFAAAMSRAWNRWIGDFCQESPERLKGSALIPLQDIDLAMAEARFAVHDLDAITLVLPSHMINGRPIYDRYYDPLWAAAQEMDVAVSFHGNHAVYSEHLAKRYLDNLVLSHACAQPVEMMLTLGAGLTGRACARRTSPPRRAPASSRRAAVTLGRGGERRDVAWRADRSAEEKRRGQYGRGAVTPTAPPRPWIGTLSAGCAHAWLRTRLSR